jgi:hypothetical protein
MRSTDDDTAAGLSRHLHRSHVARTMAVMAGPWSLDKLAAVAGETEARLRGYVDAACYTCSRTETSSLILCTASG